MNGRKHDPGLLLINGATEHYLKNLDCRIPHESLTVVSGVSGSGKSSLAFDTICREGQRRFLETLSLHARGFLGQFRQPAFRKISGLRPTMAVAQQGQQTQPRSTVGTMTDLYDSLRVLFARLGIPHCPACGSAYQTQSKAVFGDEAPKRLTMRFACPDCRKCPPEIGPPLFSFNSPRGACPSCNGLGVEDAIDPELLISDSGLTVRQGAFVLTNPKGYIMYSQVTMDVLNQVCQAHGFSVDIPWKDLSGEQRRIILYGSDRLKIPFGKHPLESRLKWTGITARPREEDYYRGILPTMDAILKKDRNPSILRFVRSSVCKACQGTRINPHALAVTFQNRTIAQLAALSLEQLQTWLGSLSLHARDAAIAQPILERMSLQLQRLSGLGLGHLSLDRSAPSLAAGEWQRIRLALQAFTDLSGLLYVLDEPSLGLHPRDQEKLLDLLFHLRDTGNTVLAVEHRREALLAADWLLDLGPGAGPHGGNLLFEGPPEKLLGTEGPAESPTREWLASAPVAAVPGVPSGHERPLESGCGPVLEILGASQYNLKNIDISIPIGKLVAVSGVSGAGKSTLVNLTLARFLRRHYHGATEIPGTVREIRGLEHLDKVIAVDQQPIGRTPRSNPSTYTGLFDHIRDLFARQPLAKNRGWNKSRFSWNVAGGRCEACQGSGVQEIGLHLLAPVGVVCEECGGKRFLPETLEVSWDNHSISDILDGTVAESLDLFAGQEPILRILRTLRDVGLGYLTLGQPSTTLSGGEAQRVKLATELARPGTGRTLYILDEPATGLHHADIVLLSQILRRLVRGGNTVIAVEHHPEFLLAADWIIDLGPEGGTGGGNLVVAGPPARVMGHAGSHTGRALARLQSGAKALFRPRPRSSADHSDISLESVSTHNLKSISVRFPKNKITVVTGVSGSGKTSLVMGTLMAESHRRYVESLSSYARRFVQQSERPSLGATRGLTPVIAIGARRNVGNPRSTVGTMSGALDFLRILMARAGARYCPTCGGRVFESTCTTCKIQLTPVLAARMFSFNHALGACPACHGMGFAVVCDPGVLVSDPGRSLLDGALDGTKSGRFFGERNGRYVAILGRVGEELKIDFHRPWSDLSEQGRTVAMHGCGERTFHVVWKFRRGQRTGEHALETIWPGFLRLVQEEYDRKRADHRGEVMADLMREEPCPECRGERLKPEFRAVRWQGYTLGDLCGLSIWELLRRANAWNRPQEPGEVDDRETIISRPLLAELLPRLESLSRAGLGYLALDRSLASLSGGEFRRLLLASHLGGELTGVTYLLDEPTIGLHSRDTGQLIELLRRLRDQGNTVIVVEHDPEIIRAADHLLELGPEAGEKGGRLIASGTWAEVQANTESLTVRWLGDEAPWPSRSHRDLRHPGIEIRGAAVHTLTGFDVAIPLGGLVVITGVSGSGKTTLVEDILLPSFETGRPVGCREFHIAKGGDGAAPGRASPGRPAPDRVIWVDQGLPSGSESSLVGTCTGILKPLADLFAKTEEARKLGLGAAAFSPFGGAGRCPACQGSGGELVDLDFLAGVRLVCEECSGSRFRPEILSCLYRGLSMADLLSLNISETMGLFSTSKTVGPLLEPLSKVGLGHLSLGRSTGTLSAGERQRLRLAMALAERRHPSGPQGSCLFVFDEPTTGLHLADVAKLLGVFQDLLGMGHSLVVVEHHLEIIRRADWIIDLGPGGGEQGGRLVVAGPPEMVASHPDSATGAALGSRKLVKPDILQ